MTRGAVGCLPTSLACWTVMTWRLVMSNIPNMASKSVGVRSGDPLPLSFGEGHRDLSFASLFTVAAERPSNLHLLEMLDEGSLGVKGFLEH